MNINDYYEVRYYLSTEGRMSYYCNYIGLKKCEEKIGGIFRNIKYQGKWKIDELTLNRGWGGWGLRGVSCRITHPWTLVLKPEIQIRLPIM